MKLDEYPLVSVITPSFNQAQFIKETIESVLNQNYPNIEHIIIDGGSTDGTLDILKRYSLQAANFRFVSEKDRGQSHAINKGLNMAKGEIIGWLNSDDTYLPGAIEKAVHSFNEQDSRALVYGKANFTNERNQPTDPYPVEPFMIENLFKACIICQPAAFIKKKVFKDVGGVDEKLHFCMDYDLWMRIAKKYPIGYIDEILANSRLHPDAKTVKVMNEIGFLEIFEVSNRNFGTVSNHWVWAFAVNNFPKGRIWLMEKLKTHSIFNTTPKIMTSKKQQDNLTPSELHIQIESDKKFPLHTLVIKSGSSFPNCYVYINDRYQMKIKQNRKSLEIEIPIQLNEQKVDIKLVTEPWTFKLRDVDYQVDNILPFSKEEYDFYCLLKQGPDQIQNWLYANRFPAPNYSN